MDNTGKNHTEKDANKSHFTTSLDEFLRSNRTVLLVVGIAILVAVATLTVVSVVSTHEANTSTVRIEALTENVGTWASEQDATKKAALEKTLVSDLTGVTTKWPRQFASARAYSLLARIAETDKDWAAAEKNWLSIYDHFPKTYLAPIALQNAAVAAEERGANDAAIAHYKLVIDKYSGKTVGIPHALFAVGRLSEESKDYPAAATSYAKLLSTYPDDDWTKLAKDRIIFLKTRGLSK